MQEHWQAKLKVTFDWFNNALLRLILTRDQEGGTRCRSSIFLYLPFFFFVAILKKLHSFSTESNSIRINPYLFSTTECLTRDKILKLFLLKFKVRSNKLECLYALNNHVQGIRSLPLVRSTQAGLLFIMLRPYLKILE